MSLFEIAVCFIIYSIVGFMLEVIYAALVLGKFVNRGFLNGPWCPIYGFGMIAISLLLKPIASNLPILFVGSFIVATLIEFIVGFLLERVFNQKWWDYSDEPFNLGGYVCLKFSLIWGIACVFVVKLILPLTDKLTELISNTVGAVAVSVLVGLMLADLAATVASIVGIKRKLRLIDGIVAKLRENSDGVGEFLSGETLELREKLDSLTDSIRSKGISKRITNAFPTLDARLDARFAEIKGNVAELADGIGERVSELREDIGDQLSELDERLSRHRAKSIYSGIFRLLIAFALGILLGYLLARLTL